MEGRRLEVALIMVLLGATVLAACTISTPCNCCDNTAMRVKIIAPNGATAGPYSMTKTGTSGTCSSSSAVTTYWSYSLGYSFCPVEGSYDAEFTATVATDTTPYNATNCGDTTTETRTVTGIYTVSYDGSKQWCDCKFGYPSHWAIGGERAATTCCGDDAGEYYRVCLGETAVCSASSDDVACCDNAQDCVYNNSCFSHGDVITVSGKDYVCYQGEWKIKLPEYVPDCAVSEVNVVPAWIYEGQTENIIAEVTNKGGVEATITVRMDISGPETYSDTFVRTLLPGQKTRIVVSRTFVSTGTYTVTVNADCAMDGDTSNNTASTSFEVKPLPS